jgi:hypothetical protein
LGLIYLSQNLFISRDIKTGMELKTLLVLEDEGAMNDVIVELQNQGIPVKRFKNTPLNNISPSAEDPEVALYARKRNMIVFTPDTRNPSFTDVVHINNKDLRPPDVKLDKSSSQPKVKISTSNIPSGVVETRKVDSNKHTMISSDKGHNGIIRMFQKDYIQNQNSSEKIAKKTRDYLERKGNKAENQIKDIRI